MIYHAGDTKLRQVSRLQAAQLSWLTCGLQVVRQSKHVVGIRALDMVFVQFASIESIIRHD